MTFATKEAIEDAFPDEADELYMALAERVEVQSGNDGDLEAYKEKAEELLSKVLNEDPENSQRIAELFLTLFKFYEQEALTRTEDANPAKVTPVPDRAIQEIFSAAGV